MSEGEGGGGSEGGGEEKRGLGGMLVSSACTRDPFDQFNFLFREPRFRDLTVERLLSDSRIRTTFFEAFVCGKMERAKLFSDLLAQLQILALGGKKLQKNGENCGGAELPALTHSFPPACPDSTCPVLLLDNNLDEPRNFRSFFGRSDVVGFERIPASGSAQFGMRGLREVIRRIRELSGSPKTRIMFVDVRQEPHCHIDIECDSNWSVSASREVEATAEMGLAACWMTQHDFGAAGLSDAEAEQLENIFVTMLKRQKCVKLGWPHNKTLPSQTYLLKGVASERELVKSAGCGYVRLFVTDHCRPRDSQVDAFVALIQKYYAKKHRWIHIHCHGGKGRTATFLCMLDMMVNCNEDISFPQFLARQQLVSGYDLSNMPSGEMSFKQLFAVERREFLSYFYLFCQQQNPLAKKKRKSSIVAPPTHNKGKKKNAWSKWLHQKTLESTD